MGWEVSCPVEWNGDRQIARLHLDSQSLTVRGGLRLVLPLGSITECQANNGTLRLSSPDGQFTASLGDEAARWAAKILRPPSRLDKLGIREGTAVATPGWEQDVPLQAELQAIGADQPADDAPCDVLLYRADHTSALEALPRLGQRLQPKGCLWVIYPKGVEVITEAQVMEAAKRAGFVIPKTCSFSATHTGLKLMRPAAKR